MNDGFAEGYAVGQGSNQNNDGLGFGSGWGGLIGLLIVASLFGGNGWGFGGFGGGRGNCATQADLSAGFNNSAVLSNLNDIILGQSQMQNYINQGFAGVNATVNTGFAGVNNAICTLGYQNQAGFNALSREFSDCCCATQRAIDGVNYNMAKSTCDITNVINSATRDIIDSQRNGTDSIIRFLTNEKICGLQAENSALKGQISQSAQTATLLNAINRTPIPAYSVPNPYCCNTGCGCGNY